LDWEKCTGGEISSFCVLDSLIFLSDASGIGVANLQSQLTINRSRKKLGYCLDFFLFFFFFHCDLTFSFSFFHRCGQRGWSKWAV
jgi:hypothetical protein